MTNIVPSGGMTAPPNVFLHNGKPYVQSPEIATTAGMLHYNLLRDIQTIASRFEEIDPTWFVPAQYIDMSGRRQPAFWVSEEGLALLSMGRQGERGLRAKTMVLRALRDKTEQQTSLPAVRLDAALLKEIRATITECKIEYELSSNATQTLAASLFGLIGIKLPEPVLTEQFYSTTDLADQWGWPSNEFGKLIGQFKTPDRGEVRLTTYPNSGKQGPQWYWNSKGKADIDKMLANLPPYVRKSGPGKARSHLSLVP